MQEHACSAYESHAGWRARFGDFHLTVVSFPSLGVSIVYLNHSVHVGLLLIEF